MRRVALLALFVFVFAASGCGSSQSDSSSAAVVVSSKGKPISKRVFMKRASAICKASLEAISDAVFSPDPALIGKSEAFIFETLNDSTFVPAISRELRELRKLGSPPSPADEAKVQGLLAALSEGLASAKHSRITSLEAFYERFERFDRLARGYGLRACVIGYR